LLTFEDEEDSTSFGKAKLRSLREEESYPRIMAWLDQTRQAHIFRLKNTLKVGAGIVRYFGNREA
jgi:hypothetical protein